MKENIGLFDMALALSVNKIRSQFEALMSGEVIPSTWRFMTDKNGTKILNDASFFETNLKIWKNAFDTEIAAKIQKIKMNIKAEKAKPKSDKDKLDELRETLETLEESEEKQLEFRNYDCALDAEVESYDVEVADKESNRLIFIIKLSKGKLYMREFDANLKAEKIVKNEFHSCKYAFLVTIGNRIIKTNEMELSAEDRKMLVTEGITDAAFNIEALFMDFQNSNISAFEESKSLFPANLNTTWLKVIMNNYFGNLKKQDNPFILGYKVEPKEPIGDSLFKPSAISYSTTMSSEVRSQSFNFLIQIDNHALPESQLRGYMPKSLIESTVDKSSGVNGVFAIDYKTFVKKYIVETLQPAILEQLKASIMKSLPWYTTSFISNEGIRCVNGWLWFDLKLEAMAVQGISRSEQEAQGIRISWDIIIKGNQHVEKPNKYLGFIDSGTTLGLDMPFSTNGEFPINGKKGRKGKLSIVLTAGTDGKLDLISRYDKPEIGTDYEKPLYKDGWDKLFDTIIDFINPLGVLGALIIKIFKDDAIHLDLDNDKFSYLDVGTMTSFSSRVVLPGSNTYTFKTVRLLTGAKDDDDALIFDIAYAPKSR